VGCFGGHGLPKVSQQRGQPEEIPLETVRAMITEWPEHLKVCVGADGSHFGGIIINKNLKKTIANKLFSSKSVCSVSFPF